MKWLIWGLILSAVLGWARPSFAVDWVDETPQRYALIKQVDGLFALEDYAGLEQLANKLRSSREQWVGGTRKLSLVYFAFTHLTPRSDKAAWDKYFQKLQHWQEKFPESITVRLVLAQTDINYAWQARGGGWASGVTQDGWRLFAERLEQAHKVLTDAEQLPTKDTELYAELIAVGMGLNLPRATVDDDVQKAMAIDPECHSVYFAMAYYLLPQWHGAPGDWQRFADRVVEQTRATDGEANYARIVWAIYSMVGEYAEDPQFIQHQDLSWPRIRQGFRDMETHHPGSLRNHNAFCWFACLAGDRTTAWQLFQDLGDQPGLDIWQNKGRFRKWRTWADPATPAAMLEPVATLSPSETLPSDTSLLTKLQLMLLNTATHESLSAVNALAFSPDGRWLAAGYADARILIWDMKDRKVHCTLTGHTTDIRAVQFSADGRWLASAGGAWWAAAPMGEVKLWRLEDWSETRTMGAQSGPFYSVAFTPDSKQLVAVGGIYNKPGVILTWDTATGKERKVTNDFSYAATSVGFAGDGKEMAVSGYAGYATWRMEGDQFLDYAWHLCWTNGWMMGSALSSDGGWLLAGSSENFPGWSRQTVPGKLSLFPLHQQIAGPVEFRGDSGGIYSLAVSRDGRHAATGGEDEMVAIWDTTKHQAIGRFIGNRGAVNAVAYSPDESLLASGSADGTIKLWRPQAIVPENETTTHP